MADGLASNQGFMQLIIDGVHLGTSGFTILSQTQEGPYVKTIYEGILKDKACRGYGLPNTIIEYRDANGVFLNAIAIFKKRRTSNVTIIK